MASAPTVLSLCAGIGGLDLAVRQVFPTSRLVCAVEIEAFASAVLAHQMAQGGLDAAPVWTDLRTFDSRAWRGCVDILTAGFPCQPFSVAGKQRGSLDPRHLWPHVRRAINGARPSLVFLENVPGLLSVRQPDGRAAFEVVRSELQRLAYRVEAVIVAAAEVGATHKRERLFILAVADSGRQYQHLQQWGAWDESARSGQSLAPLGATARAGPPVVCGCSQVGGAAVGHADHARLEGRQRPVRPDADQLPAWPPGPEDHDGWAAVLAIRPDLAPAIESKVRGVADGLSTRVDELRAYGNAVVPTQGAYALQLLLDALDLCSDRVATCSGCVTKGQDLGESVL